MRKLLISTLAILAMTIPASAFDHATGSFAEAKAQAAKIGKPLLIDFFAEWCGPCKRFAAATAEDADIQKSLEAAVLYKIDAEKGEGIELAKEFKVSGYPTFILANGEGQTIDRWMGYAKDYFIETMKSATADMTTIDEKQARFISAPDAHTAAILGRYQAAMENYAGAVNYYKQAQSLKTEPSVEYSYDIFDNMANTPGDTVFTYDEISQAADAAIVPAKSDPMKVVDISSRMTHIANQHKRPDDVAKFLQAGLDATSGNGDGDIKRAHNELMVDFSLMVKHDAATAVEYKKGTMPEGWMEDPDQLNAFAWWCFENGTNLDEAETLSRKSVELAKPGRAKANNLDTLAEIMHAKGNTREAIELSKKAAKESPDSKYFPQQVERFEKLLKNMQGS
jgi:thiol-disulfide isomerase/thioredoxin